MYWNMKYFILLIADDVYIWCRERTHSPKPSHVPNIIVASFDIKAEPEAEGSCGPVKVPIASSTVISTNPEEESSTGSPGGNGDGDGDEDEDSAAKARVVGGEETALGEFPWMVRK
jgi:hypothetical protein